MHGRPICIIETFAFVTAVLVLIQVQDPNLRLLFQSLTLSRAEQLLERRSKVSLPLNNLQDAGLLSQLFPSEDQAVEVTIALLEVRFEDHRFVESLAKSEFASFDRIRLSGLLSLILCVVLFALLFLHTEQL